MEYKLCILAAGSGKRMRPLTDNLNKALLPVNYKAAISYVIEKHRQDVEIIIAVNYEKEKIKQYLECVHNDRKIIYVDVPKIDGEGAGPGYSLICCKDYLDKPFIFSTIDTLFPEACPLPETNWMGVGVVKDPINFCTVELKSNEKLIKSLLDKRKNGTNLAFIGIAGIYDYKTFFLSLLDDKTHINGEMQVSNGFKGLINKELKPIKFSWFDIGNIDGYYLANKNFANDDIGFDFSKKDEYIYFVNNKVVKYFSESKTVKNRIQRANLLKKLIPNLINKLTYFYSYEMLDGSVLYDQKDPEIVINLLHWLKKELWITPKLSINNKNKFFEACEEFYYKKTLGRLKNYYLRFECSDEHNIINDRYVSKVSELLNQIDFKWLSKGIPAVFHGDLQFDNILFTNQKEFKLLDWRHDFSGLIEYGDIYYDLAKLNGGLYISYKKIKQNKFDIKFSDKKIYLNSEKDDFLINAKNIFNNFVFENNFDLQKIEILTGIIFLNMSPMHHSPFSHYVYYLGKLHLSKWTTCEKSKYEK